MKVTEIWIEQDQTAMRHFLTIAGERPFPVYDTDDDIVYVEAPRDEVERVLDLPRLPGVAVVEEHEVNDS